MRPAAPPAAVAAAVLARVLAPALALALALVPPAASAQPLSCVVSPSRTVRLGTAEPGLLAEVAVDRGDAVEAGQVVARLTSDVERTLVDLARSRAEDGAEIAAAAGRVSMLESRLERNERLSAARIVSDAVLEEISTELLVARQDLEAAQARRTQAALELRRAEEMLARRVIRAPASGVVTERRLGAGEYMDVDEHIVSIAVLDPLHVEAFAPVAVHGRIAIGETARVELERPIGGAHEAVVSVVDLVLDPASGTFGVRLDLPNPDFALPAGVNCMVRFGADLQE